MPMPSSFRCAAAKKTVGGQCGQAPRRFYDQRPRRIRDLSCGHKRVYLEFNVRRVDCWRRGAVKTEHLECLPESPSYTQRFAYFVAARCHDTPVKVVAEEVQLDWHTVKELDKLYMLEQLRHAPASNPTAIGIDEISMGHGHPYRIVVSDLLEGRPIWFGSLDRSVASLDLFYAWLSPEKSTEIRLAVLNMWTAFRSSTLKPQNAPQATILYDKVHVLRHLQDAMDKVRKHEYARLARPGRRFIKGQRFAPLGAKARVACAHSLHAHTHTRPLAKCNESGNQCEQRSLAASRDRRALDAALSNESLFSLSVPSV